MDDGKERPAELHYAPIGGLAEQLWALRRHLAKDPDARYVQNHSVMLDDGIRTVFLFRSSTRLLGVAPRTEPIVGRRGALAGDAITAIAPGEVYQTLREARGKRVISCFFDRNTAPPGIVIDIEDGCSIVFRGSFAVLWALPVRPAH